MLNLINKFVRHEGGATAIEYGLIAALIAVVIIGAVTAGRNEPVDHLHEHIGQHQVSHFRPGCAGMA